LGPVVFCLFGGELAKTQLDLARGWLGAHDDAVMTVLFLAFRVGLIAEGVPPLS
jgi:hypothetical protein